MAQQAPKTLRNGVIASAGSKIMMTGGYLVLNRPNNGLVIGVDARLYTEVYPLASEGQKLAVVEFIADGDKKQITIPVTVLTPQRTAEPLSLEIVLTTATTTATTTTQHVDVPYDIELRGDYAKNTFVSKSLHYTLIAIASLIAPEDFEGVLSRGLLIEIRGDREFYSALPPEYPEPVEQGIEYIIQDDNTNNNVETRVIRTEDVYTSNPLNYTTKTGLGSSAAVVSSFVSALFAYFGLLQPSPTQIVKFKQTLPTTILDTTKNIVELQDKMKLYAYRTSQIAHCIAQGKVGSGFDVSTAFYGTQQYCRFSPQLINELIATPLEAQDQQGKPQSTVETNQIFLKSLYNNWDDLIKPFVLPKYINIIVADVQGGSETPGMVKKVNEWLKTYPNADITWNKLANLNKDVENIFLQLNQQTTENPQSWRVVVQNFAKIPNTQWVESDAVKNVTDNAEKALYNLLLLLVNKFHDIRACLRQIGTEAGVPIEPQAQTDLLNQTCANNGVILAGVPGAGGYDAIFALVLDVVEQGDGENAQSVVETWGKIKIGNTADAAAIQRLCVNVDQNGGVQTKVVYKDFKNIQ